MISVHEVRDLYLSRFWAKVQSKDLSGFAVKRAVRLYVAEHPGCSRAELQRELGIDDYAFEVLVMIEGVRHVRWDGHGYYPTADP